MYNNTATAMQVESQADLMIVKKNDYETLIAKLEEEILSGRWWSMKDLEVRINKSYEWIRRNILDPPHFREILDIENGGFVFYPEKGKTWSFQARKMAEFLDENFSSIYKNHK